MGHALKEIARVLTPDGTLMEFRPLGTRWPLEIIRGDRVRQIGRVERAAHIRDDAACEVALVEAVRAGTFLRERQQTFDLYETAVDPSELTGPMVLPETAAEEARRQLAEAGEDARIRVRYHNILARYRKPSGGTEIF
ncbi:MAG TPA: hypothetical protein VFA07_05540 [Chthonomonadaceae bacterium]|nr:hypothetical protein [Chthonomonadaceae bacterium]